MRINQHIDVAFQGTAGPGGPIRGTESRLAQDRLAITGAEALNRALQQTPELRTDEVARAKRHLEWSDYPSPVLTAQIATLLAQYLGPQPA